MVYGTPDSGFCPQPENKPITITTDTKRERILCKYANRFRMIVFLFIFILFQYNEIRRICQSVFAEITRAERKKLKNG